MSKFKIGETFDLQGYMNELHEEHKRRMEHENNGLIEFEIEEAIEWEELH